jgi:hypothetical protein
LVEQELILFLDGVFDGFLVVACLDVGGFEDETVEVLFGVEGDVGCYAAVPDYQYLLEDFMIAWISRDLLSVVDSEEEESFFCLKGDLRREEDGVLVLLRGSRS